MEWTGVFCIFLALFGDIQIILMGILYLIIPEVLWLTGTYLSTIAGIVAAFTAPVVEHFLKIKKEVSNKDVVYTYSLSYRRIAVCFSGSIYVIAAILTVVGLIVTSYSCGEFRTLIMNYHVNYDTKALVDNIQFALQCCGERNYTDWFDTDWGAYQSDNGAKKYNNQRLQKSTRSASAESTICRNDAVPFSCCSRATSSACVHQDLFQLGTSTINHDGCNKKLHFAAQAYLWFEIIMYSVSLGLEITLLVLLSTQSHFNKYKNTNKSDRKFGEFFNKFPPTKSLKSASSSKSTPSSRTKFTASS